MNNFWLAGKSFFCIFKLSDLFSSTTGIVNVYETATVELNEAPKPVYTLDNLSTRIDFLKFNHNSEILSFGSSDKVSIYSEKCDLQLI